MTELAEMTRSAVKAATEKRWKPLSDPNKMAVAGIGLAALPVAVEAVAKRVAPKVADLGDQAKDKVSDVASGAVSNLGDQAKQAAKGAVASKVPGLSEGDGQGEGLLSKLKPGSSDEDGEEGSAAPGRRGKRTADADPAVGRRRRADEGAYNHWTEFEDWPEFMHRIESAEQVDDTTVSFQAKIWGISKRFEAEIVEQRPDERIEWNVTDGYAHTGVVTFHALAENLTRIESLAGHPSHHGI